MDTIVIDENNLPRERCAVCDKQMKTRNLKQCPYYEMDEVHIKIAHARCDRLIYRRRMLASKLLNLDYQLFIEKELLSRPFYI